MKTWYNDATEHFRTMQTYHHTAGTRIDGATVVQFIETDPVTKLYVFAFPDHFEWAVYRNGIIDAESREMYGCSNSALRDALMYATLGVVPVSVVDGGGYELVSKHEGLRVHA